MAVLAVLEAPRPLGEARRSGESITSFPGFTDFFPFPFLLEFETMVKPSSPRGFWWVPWEESELSGSLSTVSLAMILASAVERGVSFSKEVMRSLTTLATSVSRGEEIGVGETSLRTGPCRLSLAALPISIREMRMKSLK